MAKMTLSLKQKVMDSYYSTAESAASTVGDVVNKVISYPKQITNSFLAWLERNAGAGQLVTDLQRSEVFLMLFLLLCIVFSIIAWGQLNVGLSNYGLATGQYNIKRARTYNILTFSFLLAIAIMMWYYSK